MNGRIGTAKFDPLRIILDSGASSSIIIGKHMQQFQKKKTNWVHWITQGGGFNTHVCMCVTRSPGCVGDQVIRWCSSNLG